MGYDERSKAKIEFLWPVEVHETDIIERSTGKAIGSGTTISLPIGPYEIKTIRVVRK